jgi:hypothetical protein
MLDIEEKGLDSDIENTITYMLSVGAAISPTVLAASIPTIGMEVLDLLLPAVDDIETIGRLALLRAVCIGNKAAINRLQSVGVDINCLIEMQWQWENEPRITQGCLLQWAIQGWNDRDLKLRFPNLSFSGFEECTFPPASLEMVKYAIRQGAKTDALSPRNWPSVLHSALVHKDDYNHGEMIDLLLEHGASSVIQRCGLDLIRSCVSEHTNLRPSYNRMPDKCERLLETLFRHGAPQSCVEVLTLVILGGVRQDSKNFSHCFISLSCFLFILFLSYRF